MLGSLLSLLTVSAVVLLVPVLAGLLGTHRRTHLAVESSTRRVRLVIAASVVGLAALGVAALLGADPAAALSVALILAGAVLAWSPMAGSWAVRGVVAWALLFAGALAVLGWLVEQMLASPMSPTELVISGVAWGFLLLSLSRVQRYARDLIGAHAGLGRQTWGRRRRISLLRPALSLVVLFAAGGAVGLAANHSGPARGRVPQAGLPGSLGTSEVASAVPVSAPTVTRGGTSRPITAEAERAALAALRGGDPVLDTPRLRAPTPTLSPLGAVTGTGALPSTSVRAGGPSAATQAGTASTSTDAGLRDGAAVAPSPSRPVTHSVATTAAAPTADRASRKTSTASTGVPATDGPALETSAGSASVPVGGVAASPSPVLPDASTTPAPGTTPVPSTQPPGQPTGTPSPDGPPSPDPAGQPATSPPSPEPAVDQPTSPPSPDAGGVDPVLSPQPSATSEPLQVEPEGTPGQAKSKPMRQGVPALGQRRR